MTRLRSTRSSLAPEPVSRQTARRKQTLLQLGQMTTCRGATSSTGAVASQSVRKASLEGDGYRTVYMKEFFPWRTRGLRVGPDGPQDDPLTDKGEDQGRQSIEGDYRDRQREILSARSGSALNPPPAPITTNTITPAIAMKGLPTIPVPLPTKNPIRPPTVVPTIRDCRKWLPPIVSTYAAVGHTTQGACSKTRKASPNPALVKKAVFERLGSECLRQR